MQVTCKNFIAVRPSFAIQGRGRRAASAGNAEADVALARDLVDKADLPAQITLAGVLGGTRISAKPVSDSSAAASRATIASGEVSTSSGRRGTRARLPGRRARTANQAPGMCPLS